MGNLVSRALTLCEKHSESKIPSQESYVLFDVTELNQQFQQEFSKFNVHVAIELVNARLSDVNKWLTEKAPWHMKEDQLDEKISTFARFCTG
jgi:methionyl-tRNA synthetase